MKERYFSLVVAVVASLLIASCGKDDNPTSPPKPPPPPTEVSLGDIKVERELFAKVLKSQILATSYYRAEGGSSIQHIGPLILGMSLQDLDFDALKDLSFSFSHGVYEATYGRDHLRFVFFFAENFDSFNAGDTIFYNLFAIDSYVRNVIITLHGISYDEGTLFHLINGSIHFDGLKPVVSIGAEKLLFSMEYNGVLNIEQPNNLTDTLDAFVRTSPANVQLIANQLINEGYTLMFDSTRYVSQYYNVAGVIDTSHFNVRKREGDYWIDGEMSGRIVQNGISFYYRGTYSNHGENFTDFYLTPERSSRVGRSRQENNMRSGRFTSVTGDTLSFQLP
ncbi:MAG: hypothetical protein HY033_08875 [Ignavibacteriae bacterium]|nr:hypothetical protein [Ignavibacteria bacterium]MBI3365004.1 hypothetical protein [Ignavibacteriota bacterium]